MKIDPSSEQTDYSAMDAMPAAAPGDKPAKRPTKTVYPDLSLRGDAADQIIAAHSAGETFDAEVQFKVTGIHQKAGGTQTYGEGDESRVELEILSINKEGDETAPGEESAESAIDSYRSSKSAGAADEEQD